MGKFHKQEKSTASDLRLRKSAAGGSHDWRELLGISVENARFDERIRSPREERCSHL